MADNNTTVGELKKRIAQFISEREWSRFHNPKDLAISLSIESSELLELFQWMSPSEIHIDDKRLRGRIEEELADVAIYVLSFAETTGIDLSEAVYSKIRKNEKKYPAKNYKGKARI